MAGMERRTFLSTVALGAGAAGAGAIWLPGCGAPGAPTLRAHQIDDLLGRLERGVGRVRAAPHGGAVADRVIRVGLEALVVADVARSIPAGTHLPPALADALGRSVPVLDDCVVAYHTLLEEAPRSMRRKLDQAFRAKPDLAMDVAEQIDEHAAEIGVSADSRRRLRGVATNVGARVRRQSSSAIIDDCVAKMENVVARGGADLHAARSMTASALIQAVWQQLDNSGTPGGGTQAAPPASPGTTLDVPEPPPGSTATPPPAGWLVRQQDAETPPAAQPRDTGNPGDPELAVGGVMLGAGLAVFGIGGLISLATQSIWPVVVAATPAGVAVIIGLILLIVGGVQNARG